MHGTVTVKKLVEAVDIYEEKFSEEICSLMKANHKNIIWFLGYYSDTKGEMVDCVEELVLADARQKLLCYEYLPKGSLDKRITNASQGHEWTRRYQIMNGICDGLYYLHRKKMVLLDLKPTNILLYYNGMPKITDPAWVQRLKWAPSTRVNSNTKTLWSFPCSREVTEYEGRSPEVVTVLIVAAREPCKKIESVCMRGSPHTRSTQGTRENPDWTVQLREEQGTPEHPHSGLNKQHIRNEASGTKRDAKHQY